jgi:hypothetical protein
MKQTDPAQAKLILRVVWMAILLSQLIYLALLLAGIRGAKQPLDLPILAQALGVVALATAIGSHLCWRRASGSGTAIHTPLPGPAKSFPFYVVAWMLDESIAIYGLVLGMLAFPVDVWGLFSLVGFFLTLLHRPT